MTTSNADIIREASDVITPSGVISVSDSMNSALVYVTGSLGFDFGTFSRRDALESSNNKSPILTNSDLSSYLVFAPVDADSLLWTLSIGSTPIYAVRALGPYAKRTYQQIRAYLLDPNIDLISVAGRIVDNARLLSGQVVPVIAPDLEGFRVWSPSTVLASTGTLSLDFTPITSGILVDLTGEGSLDWTHWGGLARDSSPDHCQKLSAKLPGLTIGEQIASQATVTTREVGFGASFVWHDGTPIIRSPSPSPNLTPGYLRVHAPNAFTLTVPADNNPRILRLYVRNDGGTTGGPCKLNVNLSNYPTELTDQSLIAMGNQSADGAYTIAFQAPPGTSGNARLTVTWQPLKANFAGLQAATLQVGALKRSDALQSYLDRILFELRNMGTQSSERALNYVVTYAMTQILPRFQLKTLLGAMFERGMMLEDFAVRRNERCRPGGDCWDVSLRFFNPNSVTQSAHPSFRIAVDVSTVKPLIVGQLQSWNDA